LLRLNVHSLYLYSQHLGMHCAACQQCLHVNSSIQLMQHFHFHFLDTAVFEKYGTATAVGSVKGSHMIP